MGGDIWLLMEEGEKEKAEAFLRTICTEGPSGELCLIAPSLDSYDNSPGDCWITFEDYITADENIIKDVIRIGFTVYFLSRPWGTAVACGIRDNFKVKNIAWESLENEDNTKYLKKVRPFKVTIEIIKDAMTRNPGYVPRAFGHPEGDIAFYKEFQKLYENRIKELFKDVVLD